MSDREFSILAKRRLALMKQRNDAVRALQATDKELQEVDYAGRIVARISGAKWPPPGSTEPVPAVSNVSARIPVKAAVPVITWPEMIQSVLADAVASGIDGLSPVEIGEQIASRFHVNLPKGGISPTVWRLWTAKRLTKVREGVYAVPKTSEAGASA